MYVKSAQDLVWDWVLSCCRSQAQTSVGEGRHSCHHSNPSETNKQADQEAVDQLAADRGMPVDDVAEDHEAAEPWTPGAPAQEGTPSWKLAESDVKEPWYVAEDHGASQPIIWKTPQWKLA